ncbi:Low molecular weight protein-tyrosine-phosphatase YfkJ [Paraliobacillus sp. PM-2]|uniref:low molecular weight protein-tyrosine-phosphatase n=1 Tax=Paraliobacillus sp. PM-2 TaxID=1462524 RepID=UPI00061C9148|nr:low molecular weight protein-tyrosine-phosphatase [Paraliobacillus sp. PM-2]CQR47280.1 Low molecular weight protein-tyrosine-phosphatase YfkJ [Paraliobacillus sp. PM-2]
MINVLFICLGNICRSPMAEAMFRRLLEEEGIQEQFNVDSAGIGNWHVGLPPHEGTRKILDQKNIAYEGMKARQVDKKDWDEFDYIIAMDEQNMHDLEVIRKEVDGVKVAKLMDYVEKANEENVPDPYFTKNFDYTYQLIDRGCRALLAEIKKERGV